MKNHILIALFLSCFFLNGSAQVIFTPQVLSSQGDNFSNSEFQLSYTIGEMAAVTTITSGSQILTQGFHQPDKFTVGFESFESLWSAYVFPNPADEQVTLSLNSDFQADYTIDLFDAAGRKILAGQKIVHQPGSQQLSFSTANLSAGTYLLRVSETKGNNQRSFRFTRLPH